jgi:hypothetical protein
MIYSLTVLDDKDRERGGKVLEDIHLAENKTATYLLYEKRGGFRVYF